MQKILFPNKKVWQSIIQRPTADKNLLTDLVRTIFEDVKVTGDEAILKYCKKFDKVNLKTIKINNEEIALAGSQLPVKLKQAIKLAKANIYKFHKAQIQKIVKVETTKGVICWRENRAIQKVGIYIPGGSAPLFSSVLMLAIPAKIAGCSQILLCTPPNSDGKINPTILYTAALVGITKIYAVGGIQAIAAFTFGTNSISRVDKIFGPGNQYVTAAKQLAQNYGIAIDMPAGPSEVLIIADNTCNPSFVAADLLSQAEHGIDSQVILLSNNESVVDKILKQITLQFSVLPRKEIALKAIANSKAILLKDMDACIQLSNMYAPEHLIIATKNANKLVKKITNAGSIFIGNYSCEAVGDYASGTNHTLPTNGYAKNYSGVSVDSFVKKITIQKVSKIGIKNIGPAVQVMAEAEGLWGHKNAVTVRLDD